MAVLTEDEARENRAFGRSVAHRYAGQGTLYTAEKAHFFARHADQEAKQRRNPEPWFAEGKRERWLGYAEVAAEFFANRA